MRFYVYEDVLQRRARIHRGECGHCNEGRGKTGLGPVSQTGIWHGPFALSKAAEEAAGALGHADVRACRACSRRWCVMPGTIGTAGSSKSQS